ncbi:PDR/VanB family oxidoreductase [Plantactinospora endophytica]|uniref:Ferredoxin n=1 Tax=Plantactinospora endophytica TaxID=673535 RepID=A0ABQ4E9Y6_9ACTN|nr:PDR/VanB family oxidoreductase [Plantactinospora endophytica]GIG91548.1 ferredoxin [Plantactinospora endophytica]
MSSNPDDEYRTRSSGGASAPAGGEGEQDLLLTAKTVAADGVVVLTLRHPAGAALPSWEPGAHVDLLLRPDLVRQYSLCGDPADRTELRVAVLRETAGRGGSAYVHDELPVGATVRVRGPRNSFALLPAKRYLFIAGGIGITPIVPMLAAAEAAGADWRLVYGGRSRASMAFRTELRQRYGDRVSIQPQDETGLLDLPTLLADPDPDRLVYCCGPEPLLGAVQDNCRQWPAGTLRVERFAPKTFDEPVRRESFEVELARSGRTLTVPPDRSILQVVEEAGIPVLSSCQEGTCGTCETAVLGGTPEHRDSLLTDEEQAANDTMMICVSRSRTPKLLLDL